MDCLPRIQTDEDAARPFMSFERLEQLIADLGRRQRIVDAENGVL